MQIHNAIITGSFSYNGADLSNVTSSNAYSASLSSRTTDLESTSSVLVGASSSFSSILSSVSSSQQQLSSSFLTLTASFNAVSASQQQISSSQQQLSSSILTLTASYTALSSSYTSLSASYNTFSGSASTRITVDSASLLQVSASQQQISASLLNVISIFATTGSNSFRATQSITGSLTVTGQIVAQSINIQQVTSSIIYSSGSNNFGCDLNSRQTFTGSFYQTGSVSAFYSCVGIGTNFPTKALEIFSNVSQDGIKISGASNPRLTIIDTTNSVQFDALTTDTEAVLRTDTNHPLHLSTNGSLRLTIASTGAATFVCSVTGTTIYGSTAVCSAVGKFTSCIDITSAAATGTALRINGDNLTTGTALSIVSNDGSASHTGNLVEICNAFNAGAAAKLMCLYQGDDGDGIYINMARGGVGLTVDGAGGGYSAIFNNGNVGIGTTAPSMKLSIGDGTGTSNQYIRMFSSATDMYIGQSASLFGLGTIQAVVTDSTYNNAFGIGTLSNTACLVFATNNIPRITITGGGNVGIGSATPTNVLEIVKSQAATTTLYIENSNDAANAATEIRLVGNEGVAPLKNNIQISFVRGSGGCDWALGMPANSNDFVIGGGTNQGDGKPSLTTAEKMRITSNGYVLIPSAAASVQYFSMNYTSVDARSRQWRIGSDQNQYGDMGISQATTQGGSTFAYKILIDCNGTKICGSLSKDSGSFRIKHPLTSKKCTHQLVHSFIEGPTADLIYRGKISLNRGMACVNIDCAARMTEGTFEALNRCAQVFTTNESSWNAIKGKLQGNILVIESQNTESNDEISWMVIGERQDEHMFETAWTDNEGRVITEPIIPIKNIISAT